MAEAYIGEIRAFAFNYAPSGWMVCNGAILNIGQSTALFGIIGSSFGGNGRTTFAIPDLQGRVVVGEGSGPNLSPWPHTQFSARSHGQETVTLASAQIPAHQHTVSATLPTPGTAVVNAPSNAAMLSRTLYQFDFSKTNINPWISSPGLHAGTIGMAGASQPHENRQPVLVMTYCICHEGVYAPRP